MSTDTLDLSTFNAIESSTEPLESDPVQMIETVIFSLAEQQSAMVSATDAGRMWKFKYGSVKVFVQLTGSTESDVLTVWAPILKLPVVDQPKLLMQLLEMNMGTLEARFGVVGDSVVVLTSRTLAEISAAEVSRNITLVATLADENDESLIAQYPAAG